MFQSFKFNKVRNAFSILTSLFVVFSLLNQRVLATEYRYGDPLETPYPTDVLVPIARLFNLFILVSGAILIVLIIYSAIKMSVSLGDPRALEGAKKTLTYGLVGFGIILGFFTAVNLLAFAFGYSEFYTSPNSIFTEIEQRIDEFLIEARVIEG